jgi:hypothetical protein
MEILLGTNAECTRTFSHGIIPTFFPKEGLRSELFAYRELAPSLKIAQKAHSINFKSFRKL